MKNATATEYGLVFGSFELVSFLSSPILGKYVSSRIFILSKLLLILLLLIIVDYTDNRRKLKISTLKISTVY